MEAMEGLDGDKTIIAGAGPLAWDIEDACGARRHVETQRCFIPTANIRLFSPQVCLEEQHRKGNAHCHMHSDANEVALRLADHTDLRFLIQPGNDLPIMLTHQTLHAHHRSNLTATRVKEIGPHKVLTNFLKSNLANLFPLSQCHHCNHHL